MLKLQSFVSELGQRLKGEVWLLATGQQKLEDRPASQRLGKLKDRFPPTLRVHLATTNIRDVVHQRLLKKKPDRRAQLRDALPEAPRRPQALRLRAARRSPRRTSSRSTRCCRGTSICSCEITTEPAHPLDARTGRRPRHPRPAPAPRRAVPRAEARRRRGRRAGHPRRRSTRSSTPRSTPTSRPRWRASSSSPRSRATSLALSAPRRPSRCSS